MIAVAVEAGITSGLVSGHSSDFPLVHYKLFEYLGEVDSGQVGNR